MEEAQGRINPFWSIRVRSLVGWTILGVLPALALMFIVRILPIDGSFDSIAFLYVFSVWPILWVHWKFRRNNIHFKDFIGSMPERRQWLKWIALVAVLYALSSGFMYFILLSLSYIAPDIIEVILHSDEAYFSTGGEAKPVLAIILYITLIVVLIPFVEEIIFRGIMLHRWTLKWNVRASVIISSLIFGFLHYDLFASVMFAFVMAIMYIKTKSLWPPIFCHAFYNAAVVGFHGIVFATGARTDVTLEQYRTSFWLPVIFLIISIPWSVYYLVKNWPRDNWRMPFGPEPPSSPPNLPPACYQLALPAPQKHPTDTL